MGAIAASDKKKYQYIDYGDDDGAVLGQAASAPIGFFGITPVSQRDACTVVSNSAEVIANFNALVVSLEELGLIAA